MKSFGKSSNGALLLFIALATNIQIKAFAQIKEREANSCMDTKHTKDCEFMRKNNWCEEDIIFLKRKCDYTCGWCSESDECIDRANYINCGDITEKECNSNAEFYSTRCKKSCNWCNGLPEGTWKAWTHWSECSSTCDPGFRIRDRRCLTKNCEGKSSQVAVCMIKPCAIWSRWSAWGNCSATCDKGVKKRTRTCPTKDRCPGISTEVTGCQKPPCAVKGIVFNEWSDCSKSCGGGTRIKVQYCSAPDPNSCPKMYEDCNNHRCPYKSCGTYRYGSEKSACCTDRQNNCVRASKRVFGGKISKPKQFAWMARIEVDGGKEAPNFRKLLCGGTLVHSQYVVTAAHCLEQVTAKRIHVVLGAISKYDTSTLVQRRAVESFTMHPGYREPLNDLAIIKLKSKAAMTSFVTTLSLPDGEETAIDQDCFVAGWGKTDSQRSAGSPNLLEAKIRHLPFDVCVLGHKNGIYGKSMNETSMMCAGMIAGGVDTCEGDSGGPLMCQRCSSCSWYLAGVTSFGATQCGVAYVPGVYTRIANYEDWIKTFYE